MSRIPNTGRRLARNAGAICLAAYLGLSTSYAQTAPEPWTVVRTNALFKSGEGLSEYVAQQLEKELGEEVHLWHGEGDQTVAATAWALQNAPQRRAVLMLSEGSSTVMGSPSRNTYHLANFEPISLLMEMPWCLYALKTSPAVQQRNVFRWLSSLQRPVTIAVGVPRGKPMLWVHALTRNSSQAPKPPLQVKAQPYTGAQQLQQLLDSGADIAIGRCSLMPSLSSGVTTLGVAQQSPGPHLASLPLFTDLGLPPLSRGWYGAFVATSMAAENKQRLIAAMERIVRMPEVKRLIVQQGQMPLQLDHAASQRYIDDYKRTWQSVADLLDWHGVVPSNLQQPGPAATAMPAATGS